MRSGEHVLWDAHLARLERLTRPTSGDLIRAHEAAFVAAVERAARQWARLITPAFAQAARQLAELGREADNLARSLGLEPRS